MVGTYVINSNMQFKFQFDKKIKLFCDYNLAGKGVFHLKTDTYTSVIALGSHFYNPTGLTFQYKNPFYPFILT